MFGFFKKRPATPIQNQNQNQIITNLVVKRGLKFAGRTAEDPLEMAATAAIFVVNEAMKRSSIDFLKSNEQKRLAIGLMALVVTDCVSRVASVRFEALSLIVLTSLLRQQSEIGGVGDFINSASRLFNVATDGTTTDSPIAQFGQTVLGFLHSNSDTMLDGVCSVFPLMINLATAAAKTPSDEATELAKEFFDQFDLFQKFCNEPELTDEMLPALGRTLISVEPLIGDPTLVGGKGLDGLKTVANQLRNGAEDNPGPVAVLQNLLAITIEASLLMEQGLQNHEGLLKVLALSKRLYLDAKLAHLQNPRPVVMASIT